MTGRLEGKVALITGVGTGIGGGIAERFAAEGAAVVCTGRSVGPLENVVKRIRAAGGTAMAAELDVTAEAAWRAVVEQAVGEFGGLDVLVNNAGILHLSPVAATGLEDFRRVMRINTEGVFLGLREAVRAMQPGGIAGNGGSIINISSVAAFGAAPDDVAYGASKGAVSAMTRHAACECGSNGSGIRVNAICPGVVRTGMLIDEPENVKALEAMHPLGLGEVEDVAAAAVYLASDESRWVTGMELTVDGGLSIRP
jgi:NAD(P)-dependent dehydrogenase (short-subunit alcohol dehydrogenase family)